jgi:hypothetical protein
MRKLLMASAAILGASGSLAFAQTPAVVPANPSQGQIAAPYAGGPTYNNFNNAFGSLQTVPGSPTGGPITNMANLAPGIYAVPAPGTVTIRFGGKVEADFGVGFTSLDKTVGVAAGGANSVVGTTYKTNPVAVGSYMRLYPGFDGMAANGVRYGAQIELRENFQPAQTTGGTAAAPSIASPSVNTSAQTVMVRRAYTYIAADQVGLLRLGQGDGVIGLFDPCIFSNQCWDAGVGVFQNNTFGGFFPINASGGGATNYPWLAQAGAEYGNEKIVYLTPQIFGFDFGVQYAPSQGNAYADSSPSASFPATVGNTTVISDAQQSITSGQTENRWYNQVAVGARYMQTFGPVDVKAYGAYMHAAHESYTGLAPLTASGKLDPISLYQFGAAVTASGLTAAVTWQGGRVNNQLALDVSGGAPMNATVGGLTYANGPWVGGITAGLIDTQGSAALVHVSQRHQAELALGGNYKLAPGINLVLEYSYYTTHQGDFDFATNAVGSAFNNVKAQGLVFTTMLTW